MKTTGIQPSGRIPVLFSAEPPRRFLPLQIPRQKNDAHEIGEPVPHEFGPLKISSFFVCRAEAPLKIRKLQFHDRSVSVHLADSLREGLSKQRKRRVALVAMLRKHRLKIVCTQLVVHKCKRLAPIRLKSSNRVAYPSDGPGFYFFLTTPCRFPMIRCGSDAVHRPPRTKVED